MPAKDFGTKFVCSKCSTKFYDMRKPDPICPKCGADQREVAAPTTRAERKSRLAAAPKIVAPVEPVAETEEIPEDDDIDAIGGDEEEEAEEP